MRHFTDDIQDAQAFTLLQAHQALKYLEEQMRPSQNDAESDGKEEAEEHPGVVGMEEFIRAMLICLVTGQHMLVEGVPGLAKTRAILLLATYLGLVFRRIQNTPDLMPSDILYKEHLEFDKATGQQSIIWYPGSVFTNLLLSDELNRATPKTQAATLELMEEKKVTVLGRGRFPAQPMPSKHDGQTVDEKKLILSGETYFGRKQLEPGNKDESAFFVFATQNGIEQEGTYPLPEAQQDRFMLKVLVQNPPHADLEGIIREMFKPSDINPGQFLDRHLKTLYFLVVVKEKLLSRKTFKRFRKSPIMNYIIDLWECTHLTPTIGGGQKTKKGKEVWARIESDRHARPHLNRVFDLLQEGEDDGRMPGIELGASPRGLYGLIRAAHAQALLEGSFDNAGNVEVAWRHVKEIAPLVLRHRIKLDHADAYRFTADDAIKRLLECFENLPQPPQ